AITFAFGIALAVAAPAPAGIVTVWRSEADGQPATNQTTVRMQGPRCRIDYSPVFTTLLDGDSGCGYQILHPAKCYVRKTLAELHAASPCGNASNSLPPAPTGRSQMVAGYRAFEYRSTNACGQRILWVAPEYPDWRKFRDL